MLRAPLNSGVSRHMHTYLYRAPAGLGPINEWSEEQFDLLIEPIGSLEAVKQRLTDLFPGLQWRQYGDGWCGGHARCQTPYVDIILSEDVPRACRFIVFNKPDNSILRSAMFAFQLNYACRPESGKLVDVDG